MPAKLSTLKFKQAVASCIQATVNYIRRKEAEFARGNLTKLGLLDSTSDKSLIKKWLWLSSIAIAIFSFFIFPFLLFSFQKFCSIELYLFLVSFMKISMGTSLVLLCTATYFTIFKLQD